ncbi:uncharacterized protein A4U43_C04F30630 [Asparagus officinalis]|uniref:GDT1 family protein n=1 Tax=Asparagus officinalis TaxID=4686 RepID=A0A5P1F5B0_ASPOF|nr:uncharacterized protein A4U43_C04F30630 [Asparagus officinalis]
MQSSNTLINHQTPHFLRPPRFFLIFFYFLGNLYLKKKEQFAAAESWGIIITQLSVGIEFCFWGFHFLDCIAEMGLSLLEGFTKSLAMTVLSEIGDKTFFAAAILAMRHPRRFVLTGCLTALTVMTILSAVLGWAAPNLISRKWTHNITTVLFFGFGLWSIWEGFTEEGEAEELKEVEAKLGAEWKADSGVAKRNSEGTRSSVTTRTGDELGTTSSVTTRSRDEQEKPISVTKRTHELGEQR